jgi:hypothetical protein
MRYTRSGIFEAPERAINLPNRSGVVAALEGDKPNKSSSSCIVDMSLTGSTVSSYFWGFSYLMYLQTFYRCQAISVWQPVSHQRPENVEVRLLCHTLQHFCLHFVTRVWQFDLFFFSPKLGLKNQKHYCKFAQCRHWQKIIVRNQLVCSICLKRIHKSCNKMLVSLSVT